MEVWCQTETTGSKMVGIFSQVFLISLEQLLVGQQPTGQEFSSQFLCKYFARHTLEHTRR
jgi:hypothetical protein